MGTSRIDRQVGEAIRHEKHTGALAKLLRQFAQLNGAKPSNAELAGTVTFVEEYVRHAPALLQALVTAAEAAGVRAEVTPIVNAAEQYFLAPFDFIPDQLGLLGVMDDAYLAHSLVQAASEMIQQRTGAPLLALPADLPQANLMIRCLIGEPLASQLDAAVAGVVAGPALQQALNQFPAFGANLPLAPDPVWGNMSIKDRVDHQMGMLGIF